MAASLLGYPEGSAGQYMTPEVVARPGDLTLAAAGVIDRAGGGRPRASHLLAPLVGAHDAAGEAAVAAQASPARGGAAGSADMDRQISHAIGFREADQIVEGEELALVADTVC